MKSSDGTLLALLRLALAAVDRPVMMRQQSLCKCILQVC